MKVWALGTGSEGNAVLVECGESRVLVDAGFAPRTLAGRLRAIGVAPSSIEACVLTHEHGDHMRGAAVSSRRWGWKLFASAGTVDACPELVEAGCVRVPVNTIVTLTRASFTVHAVPHDAASPVGVRVTSASTGASAVVCTDLGYVSESVRTLCAGADILVLESNHDEGMLRAGPYPPSVRDRIASRFGHLSNRVSAQLVRDVMHKHLAHVVLSHLSQSCNDLSLAHRTMTSALRTTKYRGTTSVSPQDRAVGPFVPSAGRADPPAQLSLGF